MKKTETDYLAPLRSGAVLTIREEIGIIWKLSVPAILAMLSSVLMQYIDAAMVGSLGASSSAAIGIVASSTWLINGICSAFGTGFTVLVAHHIGGGREEEARSVVKDGLLCSLLFSAMLSAFCLLISARLPAWLGGGEEIRKEASAYFRIYALSLPLLQLRFAAGGMLECSGNMKVPGMLNILMCFLDVVFNFFCIFPSVDLTRIGLPVRLPGLGMGVAGAALGTGLAIACAGLMMLHFLLFRSEKLHMRAGEKRRMTRSEFLKAMKIALPLGAEQITMGGAQVVSTRIVSPLGTIALAANSFAVTAESLCYMPGFGVSSAATAIVGQSVGAGRRKTAAGMGWLCTLFGMGIMAGAGLLMYIFAPQMIGILSPDLKVRALGTQVLRIEAFAEPMFAASIIVNGVFRGIGDTLAQWLMNLFSMWAVRLTLAAYLAPRMGLCGVWTAMAAELTVRGLLALCRLAFSRHTGRNVK